VKFANQRTAYPAKRWIHAQERDDLLELSVLRECVNQMRTDVGEQLICGIDVPARRAVNDLDQMLTIRATRPLRDEPRQKSLNLTPFGLAHKAGLSDDPCSPFFKLSPEIE
jgi:hypothetical protein